MRISDWSSDVCPSDLEEGITTSELVRRVLILFLGDRDRPQFNAQRMAIICEYMQLVADEWVKTHAPDRRDEFLSVIEQRLDLQIGRTSCRESVFQNVWITEVAVAYTQKKKYMRVYYREI